MDLDLSNTTSSSSKLPQTAAPPMTEVARECDHVLRSLDRDKYAEALQILESTLSRHSASPVIDATRSLVYYKTASRIRNCASKRLEHLVKALESSRQAAALAPTSTSCALFHAQVLLRLRQHEDAFQECERGLKIERPEEPGSTQRMPKDREMKIRWRLWELRERSNLKIILLEPWKQRDKWKQLLEDKSLLKVKSEMETLHQKKKKILAARSEDFLQEKKVDMKEQWKKIWRVKPSWTGMPVDRKKAMRKIGIQELQAHFTKNNIAEKDLAEEFLKEALDFAKEAKTWRFWKCFRCGDRFLTDQSTYSHIIQAHLGTISGDFRWMIPDKAREPFIKRVENGVWKPVESSWPAKIMAVESNILLHQVRWPLCDDSNREGLIKEIRAKLLHFLRSGYFGSKHFQRLRFLIKDLLRNHIPEQKKVDQMFTMTQLQSVCFLEVPELKRVLEWLEDLTNVFALPCVAETLPDDQDFYRDVRDRVIFNTEFSDILLDEQLLLAETTDLKDDANAVGDSSTCLADLDPNDDAFFYWLWERDPPIPERLQTWASMREASRSRGQEFFKIVEAEFHRLKKLFEMKPQFSRYEKAFEGVEKMYLEVRNRRLQGVPQSYLGMLVKRWSDIKADGEAVDDVRSLKLDVIWSILKATQEDTGIEKEFQRQRQRLDQQLFLLDVLILATNIALELTNEALKKLCAYDYRFILVPMLRSFVQKRLEDLVNKDAAEKASMAVRRTLLEELALDATKNTDKSSASPKQGQKKSKKNKKKKKHSGKPEDVKATGSAEEQHSIQEENDGKDPDSVIAVPASTDQLNQQELDEREIEEVLEGLRRPKNAGGTSAVPSEHNEDDVGSSKKQQRQSGSVPLPLSDVGSCTPERKDVFQAKSESDEEQHSKAPEAEQKINDPQPEIGVAAITDQLTQQELDERMLEQALERQGPLEREAKEKWFVERNMNAGGTSAGPSKRNEDSVGSSEEQQQQRQSGSIPLPFSSSGMSSFTPEQNFAFRAKSKSDEEQRPKAPEAKRKRNDLEPEIEVDAITDQLTQQELDERMPDEALERQGPLEREAKEKWFVEQNMNAGGTSAGPSKRNEDSVGSSEEQQQQQRQSGSIPLPFSSSGVSSFTPEQNFVFRAKSKSDEEQHPKAPEAERKRNDLEPEIGIAAIPDQLRQQKLETEQEHQARKLDEALEWQRRVEKEAKEMWFAERNKNAGNQLSRQECEAEQQYLAEKLEEAWQCKRRAERKAKQQHSKSPEDVFFNLSITLKKKKKSAQKHLKLRRIRTLVPPVQSPLNLSNSPGLMVKLPGRMFFKLSMTLQTKKKRT